MKALCGAHRHPSVPQSQVQGANLTPLKASSSPYLFLNTSHVQRGVCTDKGVQGPDQIPPLLLSGEADSDRTGDSIRHPKLTLMLQSPPHVPPFAPCAPQPSPHAQLHATTQHVRPRGRSGVKGYLVCDGCCPGNHIWMSRGSGQLACKRFEPVRMRKEKAMSLLPPRATGEGEAQHTPAPDLDSRERTA